MQKMGVFKIVPKRFKARYDIDEKVRSSGIYECSFCGNYTAFRKGEVFTSCEDCGKERGEEQNKWFVTNVVIHFMSKNLNIEFERLSGFQVKIADKLTEFAGTMGFAYFHVLWFTFWIFANAGFFGKSGVFDPFPYGLLTMIVSLEAIFLATFIMISQNISNLRSELRAENDYQVNLKTEKEVAEIMALLKEMRDEAEASRKKEEIFSLDKKAGKRKRIKLVREEKLLKEAGIDFVEGEKSSAIG